MNPLKRPPRTDIRLDTLILYLFILVSTLLTLGIGTLSALSAAYKALFRRLKTEGDETNRVNTFISDMKKTMPKSIIVWIILVASSIASYHLLVSGETPSIVVGLVVAVETLMVVFYGAAGFALFNYRRTVFVFKTALLMGHLHMLTTAKLFAGIIFTAAFSYLLTPFIILLTFPFILFFTAHAFYPVFRIYIKRIEADEAVKKETEDLPSDTE